MEYVRGTETILLVEDEEPLRKVFIELLSHLGYRVLPAANGKEAVALSDEHRGKIHVLMTDVVMPELAGPELAQQLTAKRPDMKVIFISGYPVGCSLAPDGILKPDTVLVHKPFTMRAMSAKIRELLDN